jgi:hypothetical protein
VICGGTPPGRTVGSTRGIGVAVDAGAAAAADSTVEVGAAAVPRLASADCVRTYPARYTAATADALSATRPRCMRVAAMTSTD